ncbi:TlpA family protein disulfide reductase [Flavisolibacter ginsenosidimutans]|uniref:Redoxin domain-containing protein n=1 Tax=Flavisolibacter ginsenosidimutans TaxID=661481 RepID=A0A5B8UJ92_9BACT|nr:TlpA disulfide reductase family protein [Flavisolibacter ginsenosidimutans]QEC56754.1 redoxin domain-containing protein [Flavisolibacter ginsenosidimutans]
MKKLTSLLLAFCLTLASFAQQAFEVMTKKPTPGSTIVIEYMPRNTVLQGKKDFEATAYLLEGGLPRAVEVPLKQEGGIFRGSVKTADSTRAVFFAFAKDEIRDNNNDEGYYTALYDKKGEEVPGAHAALASAFGNFGGIWGLKRNQQKGAELNKKEFANTASQKKFATEYASYLSQSKDAADQDALRKLLTERLKNEKISEADLTQTRFFYQNALKDKAMADSVAALLKSRYPAAAQQTELVAQWNKAKTLPEREEVYQKFAAVSSPANELAKNRLEFFDQVIAGMYADSGNYEAAKKYLARIENKQARANALNSIAWKLSGEGINKQPKDAKAGLDFSKQSLALVDEEKKAMKNKPAYLTAKQYQRNLDNTHNMYADTYATLLYHKGDYEQAYAVEKAAVEGFKRKDASMNEAFTALTEKTKGAKAAQAELEKFMEEGKYTPAMKEQLQRLYIANGGTQAQWTSYISNLEEAAYNKFKAELAKQMINVPAPQFALKDLDGKEVSLASLKGKIVVVDFWATWCGPCRASFPGMQTAVNKYKNNPDVAFLFIDTWENDSNRVQKVTDFVAQNKYSFHVLYDDAKSKEGNDFVVVENFKVEGIPTKFVIDRNNNIRFKAVGFDGTADELATELTAMIDMVNAEGGDVKKGF